MVVPTRLVQNLSRHAKKKNHHNNTSNSKEWVNFMHFVLQTAMFKTVMPSSFTTPSSPILQLATPSIFIRLLLFFKISFDSWQINVLFCFCPTCTTTLVWKAEEAILLCIRLLWNAQGLFFFNSSFLFQAFIWFHIPFTHTNAVAIWIDSVMQTLDTMYCRKSSSRMYWVISLFLLFSFIAFWHCAAVDFYQSLLDFLTLLSQFFTAKKHFPFFFHNYIVCRRSKLWWEKKTCRFFLWYCWFKGTTSQE